MRKAAKSLDSCGSGHWLWAVDLHFGPDAVGFFERFAVPLMVGFGMLIDELNRREGHHRAIQC